MRVKIKAFLELMRPANVITALTDVVAGMAIVGFSFGSLPYQRWPIILLGISSMCLYAGGVVFNDIFDHDLDKIERPERALPSGRILRSEAIFGGILLLSLGIFLAFWQNRLPGFVAIIITALALFYDYKGKHMKFFGPINMGLCRAFNLLLGMSVYELGVLEHFPLIGIPLIYIAAITLVSRGEVHGSQSTPLWIATGLFLIVHISQIWAGYSMHVVWQVIPLVCVHAGLMYSVLIPALKNPSGANIGKTVKMGVLTLILMNAAWASVSQQAYVAYFVLALLPLSMWIGKKFAVS